MSENDPYSFEVPTTTSAEQYLAAVTSIAAFVLDRAVAVLGAPTSEGDWYGSLVDVVNEVYVGDAPTIRVILGRSPSIFEITEEDVNESRDLVDSPPDDFGESFLGHLSYRVLEHDLWLAVEQIFVSRHGAELWEVITGK